MMQHTPGPWTVQAHEDGHNVPFYTINQFDEDENDSDTSGAIHAANARLIAAAPDMLRILDDCYNFIKGGEPALEARILAVLLAVKGS